MDKTRLKSSAHQKPSTLKPETRLVVNKIRRALITNVNKPKVKMLTGNVKITKIGLIKVFKTPMGAQIAKKSWW